MPIGNKKPHGLLLIGFRLPIWLYRMRLGWLLGERFLLLTHVGRKSGSLHQTVIEVVDHEESTDTYFVVSGFGYKSDWLMNVKHNPNASITVGRRTLSVQAKVIPDTSGAGILLRYAKRHPMTFGELAILLTGKSIEPTEENCLQFVRSMPVIAFEPNKI